MSEIEKNINDDTRQGASASLVYALAAAKKRILHLLDEGHEIILEKETEQATRIKSPLPYRYKATSQVAEIFLHTADPHLTGLAETLIVDQVLNQLTDEGYARRNHDYLRP